MSTLAATILCLVVVFQASYYVLCQPSTCGIASMSERSSGYLSSPRKNGVGGFTESLPIGLFDTFKYPSNTDCVYNIQSKRGTGIKLKWQKFDVKGDMPSCRTDYVEVFIGCGSQTIGKFCSSNLVTQSARPFEIYSPDTCLKIKFHSGSSNSTGKGFLAYFTTFDIQLKQRPDQCSTSSYGYVKSGYYGTISSSNWPQRYPTIYSSSCYFRINVGSSYHAKIVFMDFDLYSSYKCDKTKIKIKGGGSSYKKAYSTIMDSRCGSRSPFTLTTTENTVYVRFKPGENDNNRGFVAGYILYRPVSGKNGGSSGGWPSYILAIIVIAIVIGIVVFCVCRRRRAQQRANQGAVHYQAAAQQPPPAPGYAPPQQPPPGQGYAPPPSYDQPAGQPYPQPYPQQGPPPGSYPEKQGPYPPPQGYPPPGSQPYPAPDGQQYPPPGGQPYPPPGAPPPYPPSADQPYPPLGGQPYPPPGGAPYPPPGGQPFPPPGGPPGPPYPT